MTATADFAKFSSARQAKGLGSGTDIGFKVSQLSQNLQVVSSAFDVYNNCSLNYYLVGLGSNLQSLHGISNFVTNMAFRLLSSSDTSLTDLQNGLTAGNFYSVGYSLGAFIRNTLTVQIPVTSTNKLPYLPTNDNFAWV